MGEINSRLSASGSSLKADDSRHENDTISGSGLNDVLAHMTMTSVFALRRVPAHLVATTGCTAICVSGIDRTLKQVSVP